MRDCAPITVWCKNATHFGQWQQSQAQTGSQISTPGGHERTPSYVWYQTKDYKYNPETHDKNIN